jgi:NADH-quinone oxidoreductase subunit L
VVNPLHLWIILFAPLVSAVVIALFLLKQPKIAAGVSLAGILTSLGLVINIFVGSLSHKITLPFEVNYLWLHAGPMRIDFGFLVDPLSVLMLLVVTGVGSCIFLYSVGYMHGDKSFARFFASLSMFAFSMIGIVLSPNFLMLFIFWELVAVSSYLLISFWFEKPSAADAGNKAFIVNRVADFGFLLGILLLWVLSGHGSAAGARTLNFHQLHEIIPQAVQSGLILPGALFLAVLLIFCGVAGKSAQFPLYIWLPDAMEGPTPVSALIHAATMVAAGIYMMARVFFMIELSADAMQVIAVVGALTAVLAAGLAVVQTDIKKILAYSTVSQLGYMGSAIGLGSAETGMFHLTTHAFFKALLFLGAGAIIHGLHTQNIWEMGGVIKKMPITAITFLIGTLALCGIWPFAGFFSKDAILALSYGHHPVIFWAGWTTALLTAFYMTRLIWVAVLGSDRKSLGSFKHDHSHDHKKSHAAHGAHGTADGHGDGHAHEVHEAPFVMLLPLLILSVFSIIGGFIGIPGFLAGGHEHAAHHAAIVPYLATGAAIAGILLGSFLYAPLKTNNDPVAKLPQFFYRTLVQKYYLDEVFAAAGNFFQKFTAGVLYRFDINVLIKGLVNFTAESTRETGSVMRKLQTGRVANYALVFALGLIGVILFTLTRTIS